MSQLKYWDGTAWVDAVIGAQGTTGAQGITGSQGTQGTLGIQGSSATAQFYYWNKTVAGGETSLSGNDDSGTAMAYTVGQELFYLNGVLLERGVDYIATTGNSITGLSALSASDIATLWSPYSFTMANTYSQAQIDTIQNNLIVAQTMRIY